jgi:PhoH-like ATPase
MRPWLQPYADAINFLHRGNSFSNKKQSQRKMKKEEHGIRPYDRLTEEGLVEITAIEYIRGRSIPNRLFVLDEVQNVPQGVVKTIASRMAEGSKLVCLGDIEQIDNPYLDKHSNGLVHIQANMRNLPNVAHIQLWKGERSLLAEQAAKLL